MTAYDTVRLKAAQALGFAAGTATSFGIPDYQALTAGQAQALDDLTALYIAQNPSQFSAGQVRVAQAITTGPGFSARFAANYASAATGFLQTVKTALTGAGDFAESAAKASVSGAASYVTGLKYALYAGAGLLAWLYLVRPALRKKS